MNVALLSIAFDSEAEQIAGAAQTGITDTPMLVDADHQVSQTYDVLKWASWVRGDSRRSRPR